MNIIRKPRRGGKTHDLIKKADIDNEGGVIVCQNHHTVNSINALAKHMGATLEYEPITYFDFIDGKKIMGKHIKRFHIDEVEHFFRYFTNGGEVTNITSTCSIDEYNKTKIRSTLTDIMNQED